MHLLNVDSMLHLRAFDLAGFVKLLTAAELFYHAGLIELTFEFLNRTLDVLSIFYGNYDHFMHLLSLWNTLLTAFNISMHESAY